MTKFERVKLRVDYWRAEVAKVNEEIRCLDYARVDHAGLQMMDDYRDIIEDCLAKAQSRLLEFN